MFYNPLMRKIFVQYIYIYIEVFLQKYIESYTKYYKCIYEINDIYII